VRWRRQSVEDAKTPLLVAQGEIETLKRELEAYRRHEIRTKKELESLDIKVELERKALQVSGPHDPKAASVVGSWNGTA
jgi:hypothetical protein